MTDVNCYITTFNCGRTLVDIDHFSTNFFNGFKTNATPDLVVLYLQEIAPIGYSFLGGSFLAPYFARLATAIHLAASKRFEQESQYENVLVRNVGMTAIMVFAMKSFEERIRWIETAGVGVGVWEMGNKGCVACRMGIEGSSEDDETTITFAAAHLAPMENAWEQRNKDWRSICEGLIFETDRTSTLSISRSTAAESEAEPLLSGNGSENIDQAPHTLFSPSSHIFFGGDLNYRTSDTSPSSDDYKSWPQPVDSESDVHHYSHLLERDQLSRERKRNTTLHYLTESEIAFPPTYKYSVEATERAAPAPSTKLVQEEDESWLWARHRVPSWCDRILYLASTPPTVHSYAVLPVQPTSDHRPVVLSVSIPSNAAVQRADETKSPFAIRPDWKEARAAARRYEWAVGLAAYLSLTWEGEALLGGSVVGILGGYLALRALIGT